MLSEKRASGSSLIPVLAGPTGVGKTALSITLAERLDAEIISADSRQVFRQLNVGTAKPAPFELARVAHHFIDERSLGEPFSAGIFADEAASRIHDILSRGRTPLVVGGSTLYLQALLHGLAAIPAIDSSVRVRIEQRLAEEGAARMYGELQSVDPAAAATMDPTKTQRLIRALEVFHGTGRPLSSYYHTQQRPPFTFKVFVLFRERSELYTRIDERVDAMLTAGLVSEVKHLLSQGYDPNLNALQTIGYQEPIAYLRGEISYAEMVRLIKRNSRRYAKRQLTWFRRFPEYTWLNASEDGLEAQIYGQLH